MTNQTAHIADLYAIAKAELDAAEKRVKDLRKQILATGCEEVKGFHFTITVTLSERSSLDTAAVKEILTDEQISECTKTTLVETLRIKAAIPQAA